MGALTARSGRVGIGDYTAYDQGAQVTTWHVDGVPVIWTSSAAHFEQGREIRGGVPICWPWFARGPSGDRSPNHGFARTAPWRLLRHDRSPDQHQLVWRLTEELVAGLPGAELFPHAFEATCTVTVDEAVTVELEVANTGDEAFDYEVALHSYLHVGDVRQVQLTGLEGADYFDKVDQVERTQLGRVSFEGETDRIYRSTGLVRVHDPVLSRAITVSKAGSLNTVVWTPWVEKTRQTADLDDDEWTELVCVETACVGEHAIGLAPGQRHAITTRVSVEPAPGREDGPTG